MLQEIGVRVDIEKTEGFGSLYRKLRTRASMTQAALAKKLHMRPGKLGKLEAGDEQPPADKKELMMMADAVGATTAESHALLIRAARQRFFPQHPNDLLFPITIEEEIKHQRECPPDELWIITNSLLEEGEFYEVTRENIEKNPDIRYVYFQPNPLPFYTFLDTLKRDVPLVLQQEGVMEKKITCIQTPRSFAFASFTIANPEDPSRMYGRISLRERDRASYVFPLDEGHLVSLVNDIRPIRNHLRNNPSWEDKREGEFRKIYPSPEHTND